MVGSLIVAALTETAVAAFTFAQTAAAFAINFAVSSIVTRVFGQDQQGAQDNGVRQQVPPSNANAIPIVYGDAYLGGTFVDAVLTTNQQKMYYVMAISSISPNGQFSYDFTDMYYGDRLITFDPSEPGKVIKLTDEAGNEDTTISGNLFIYCFTSNQSGTITPINSSGTLPSGIMSVANDVPSAQAWPSSGRQMNGLAFAIVVLNYNRDAGTTNLSPITFHVHHYLNGTGCAKPGDVWFDYITNVQYGGAVDTAFVDDASATALNSYADQLISFKTSGGTSATQPRYRINGVLDAGQTVLSNLDKIMTCSDSWMAYNAATGKWSIVINKAETPAYSFTDDNIIGDIRVSATDITQSINQVEAKFPFKENRDQPDYVNIKTPDILLYPNEPVNKYSVNYDLVNDSVTAQYLANRILEQAREDLIVSFSTTYYGIQVNAGDVIEVTNSDYGWNQKLFRAVKVNEASLPDGSLGARIEMTEYNAGVYDDYDVTQFTPVPNSNLPSPNYFSPLTAPVVSASYPAANIPNFSITITIPSVGRITNTTIFYTTSATPSAGDWKQLYYAATANNQPVTNSISITFPDFSLPAGSYYFAFNVGNQNIVSTLSPVSSVFNWSPTGMVGPTGPTGPSGSSGTSGVNGLTALTAYKVQSQSAGTPSFTTPTAGPTAPSGWSLTAPSVSVGQVMWYIQGKYNSNPVTVDGVAANTTAWTGPIAASIFQDIRSDNWNGSNPPVAGTPSTYGTIGYYIQQSTGDVFLNSVYGRGIAQFDGATSTTYGTAAISLNSTASQTLGLFASSGVGGIGAYIVGNGGGTGAYIHGFSGNGMEVYSYNTSGYAARFEHAFASPAIYISNGTFKWGSYIISQPVGDTSLFLRNDGQWATPGGSSGVTSFNTRTGAVTLTSGDVTGALGYTPLSTTGTAADSNSLGGVTASGWTRIFVGNTGTANAAGSGMNFNVTFAGYQFRGTSNYMYLETVSDARIKKDIEPETLGLDFINQLKPVTYRMKEGVQTKFHGFIAQDVENLIAGEGDSLKTENPDGIKGVDYISLIAPLTKAIQELSAKVNELEQQLKG